MSEEAPAAEPLVSSETVFSGRIVTLKLDLVRVGDAIVTREVVEHPGSATVVPLLAEGRVVMIRQYRHPARQTLWELPAGTLEPGEDPEACARRELAEEVGYEAGKWKYLFSVFLTPGYSRELSHLYLATDLTRVARGLEADERITAVEVPLGEAVAMVARGEVQNANAAMGLLAVARRCQGTGSGV